MISNLRFAAVLGAAAALFCAGTAHGQQFIYGNAAGSNNLHQINATTGAVVKTCAMGKGNGRGIVVVGTTTYYTVADSPNVYKTDFATCADNGIAFTVAGVTGLSTIAFDGTNLWVGDYSGPNRAYLYTPTGTLLNTITLANCTSFCDGLEFYQGKLISNDADGGSNYSIYSTSGVLQTANFIQTGTFTTGIAFDGTNFYISAPTASPRSLLKYNGTTGAFIATINLSTADQIEDLSADYAIVIGPAAGPVVVPTLSEWGMILIAALLALSAFFVIRRRRS